MNKQCARCNKVVYPIEELKCLDKTWHKTCFKCTECNMVLNMKTYKGFNKSPYCEAHIPKAKATTIAETPELKRIAENTKIQSNVKYHADFEKSKGKVTQVADDPETLRIKQNTKNISNVAYHGDIQKKAAMERQRELTEIVDNKDNNESEYFSEALAAESSYQQQQSSPTSSPYNSMDSNHANQYPSQNQINNGVTNNNNGMANYPVAVQQPPSPQKQQPIQQQPIMKNGSHQVHQQNGAVPQNNRNNIVHSAAHPSGGLTTSQQIQQQLQQKYYDQYENYARPNPNAHINNTNHSNNINNNQIYNGSNNKAYAHPQQPNAGYNVTQSPSHAVHMQQQMANNYYNNHQQNGGGGNPGKIADYDPVSDGPRNVAYQPQRQTSTLVYSSDRAALQNQQMQQRRIGSVNDIDPVNGYYSSIAQPDANQQQMYQQQQYILQQQKQAQQMQQAKSTTTKVRVYRALYDYEAQDTDEVGFMEGDLIFEVNSIDAGWMTGRVERTGKTGMLPANYVELAMI